MVLQQRQTTRLIIGFIVLFLGLMLQEVYAAEILDKKFTVTQKGDAFLVYLNATVKGDYERTVNRLIDFANYDRYGLDYLQDIQVVTETAEDKIVWAHMRAYAMEAKYYSRISIERDAHFVKAKFTLIPKNGPYQEDHMYDHFSGKTHLVKLNKKEDGKDLYQVFFTMKLILDSDVPKIDFIIRHMLRSFSNQTLRALLQ